MGLLVGPELKLVKKTRLLHEPEDVDSGADPFANLDNVDEDDEELGMNECVIDYF